jgi:very-short-patch-repair endonuclease
MKFRRQMPIKSYAADFCCESAGLVVELDGAQPGQRCAEDVKRTADLEACGFLVMRVWTNDVLTNIDGVLASNIATASQEPLTLTLSPSGRRNTHEFVAP